MTAPAAATVTVAVTEKHIADGVPGNCAACPVALAILGAIPGAVKVQVLYASTEDDDREAGRPLEATVWLDSAGLPRRQFRSRLALPAQVREFVTAFDGFEPVSPFTFEAEVVPL